MSAAASLVPLSRTLVRRALVAIGAITLGGVLAGTALVAQAPAPAAPAAGAVEPPSQMTDRTPLASLVAAERAFSRLSKEQGMKAAFLANLADDSVLFRPGPVPGRSFTEARPSPPIELTWWPVYAEVSAGGDLGYTTGPYELRAEGAVKDRGYYVTAWQKAADGSWKVAADLGVSTPAPAAAEAQSGGEVAHGVLAASSGAADSPSPASVTAQKALLDAERNFAGDAAAHGARAAYMSRLAPEARLYRDDVLPVSGREAIGRALAAGPQRASSWQATAAKASANGDLGFTYGNTSVMGEGAPNRIAQSSKYFRVWERQRDGSYKIVLDLVSALPEAKPAAAPAPAPGR
jgi:ketosteroid isomerase-like protein